MNQPTMDHEPAFEQAYRRMVARRRGEERAYLHVKFLRGDAVVKERILEERYACRKMADWTARGIEFKVRNAPVQLPRFGVAAALMQTRACRSTAVRFLQ
jgi:hypothetical protein